MIPVLVAVAIGAALLGVLVGWLLERWRLARAKSGAEAEGERIRGVAEQDAERIRKAADLAGREAAYRAKEEWEREEAKRREDVERAESRLEERRSALDRKYDVLDEKERQLEGREAVVATRTAEVQRQAEDLLLILAHQGVKRGAGAGLRLANQFHFRCARS